MTVYVVQKQMRFDDELGELVPRFPSIEMASKWGDLKYLLSPSAHPFKPDAVLKDLHGKLKNYGDEDFLLLIGNPALIGMSVSVAAHYNKGAIQLLQWSGRQKTYTEICTRLF